MILASSKSGEAPELSILNVALALSFISVDAILSVIFNLGIASSLIVAAARCVLQLSVMGLVLDKVFAAGNIWGVFGIAALLNVLGATEATFNKSKKRFHNMFPMVLLAMLSATFPIGILGSQYAMAERPFWKPNQFVPIIGMILGKSMRRSCSFTLSDLDHLRRKRNLGHRDQHKLRPQGIHVSFPMSVDSLSPLSDPDERLSANKIVKTGTRSRLTSLWEHRGSRRASRSGRRL